MQDCAGCGAHNASPEEEAKTVFETTAVIQETPERFLSTYILPNKHSAIGYRWSGVMGFTPDKQPLTKKISEHITAIVACNGIGIALSTVIAEGIKL